MLFCIYTRLLRVLGWKLQNHEYLKKQQPTNSKEGGKVDELQYSSALYIQKCAIVGRARHVNITRFKANRVIVAMNWPSIIHVESEG